MEGQLFIYAINETQEVWQDLGTGRFYIQDGKDRVSISGQQIVNNRQSDITPDTKDVTLS